MNDPRREVVIKVAESFLYHPTPYRWGGNDPFGVDCSGGVVYCYQSGGILKMKEDYSANGLWKYFRNRLETSGVTHIRKASPDPGDAVFWFDEELATHVEIALNAQFVIGASGSGRPKFDADEWIEVLSIRRFYDELTKNQQEIFYRLLERILFADQAESDNAFWSIKPITYRGHSFEFIDPFLI